MNPADPAPESSEPRKRRHSKHKHPAVAQGDFTTNSRLLYLCGLAIPIGVMCSLVAVVLQRLISYFTQAFFYHDFDPSKFLTLHGGSEFIEAHNHHLGAWGILPPVIGGLIVGLMAKFGSEKIRGDGIPEALEAILIGGSRMSPKVAVLKPLSSAVAIGSGGPFGAEGPIIMTGGVCGSIFAQIFHLSSAERKTLLVAGAAGGMAATFGTPLAAVLLAVEVMLFEWKPRSLIPVTISAGLAAMLRPFFFGDKSMPMMQNLHPHAFVPSWSLLLSTVVVGLSVGVLSLILTWGIYAAEDAFEHFPIHWMWWPAIGGLVVGISGFFQPKVLGVGYDLVHAILQGNLPLKVMLGLMILKAIAWAIALGSGTSGGVFAPFLIIGGSLGAIEAGFLPGHDVQLCALIGMAGVLSGPLRAPLTGAIFALEFTYDTGALVPLVLGSVLSYGFTVLTMKRSILTEKVARRGLHVSQEFGVDPLERVTIGQVMSRDVVTIPAMMPIPQLVKQFFLGPKSKQHQGYPVVSAEGRLLGMITKTDLLDEWAEGLAPDRPAVSDSATPIIAFDMMSTPPVTAFPHETCRTVVERMLQTGIGRLVIVDVDDPTHVVGMATRSDVLKSRAKLVDEEMSRERFYKAGGKWRRGGKAPKTDPPRKTA